MAAESRLTLLEKLDRIEHGCRFGLFLCSCGNKKEIVIKEVNRGEIKSCGCLKKERNHGLSKHPTHRAWYSMIRRCYWKGHEWYHRYGGRGITVCERWLESYDNFVEDMGEVPDGLTLDRIDNNGNYCKENCKWSTWIDQRNNKSNNKFIEYNGKRQTQAQWGRELGIEKKRFQRLMKRMTIEEVIEKLNSNTLF